MGYFVEKTTQIFRIEELDGTSSQSLYSLEPQQLESFSIGATGGNNVLITRTGPVTGFITLQTTSDASAACVEI